MEQGERRVFALLLNLLCAGTQYQDARWPLIGVYIREVQLVKVQCRLCRVLAVQFLNDPYSLAPVNECLC